MVIVTIALAVLAVVLVGRKLVYHVDRLVWQVRLAWRRHRAGIPPPDVEPELTAWRRFPFR